MGKLPLLLLIPALISAQYVGSRVCQGCHPAKFEPQSKTGHARALVLAPSGSPGRWAFGAGEKAITYVSQTGPDTVAEHGLSYYTTTKSRGIHRATRIPTMSSTGPSTRSEPLYGASAVTLQARLTWTTGTPSRPQSPAFDAKPVTGLELRTCSPRVRPLPFKIPSDSTPRN